MDKRIIKIGYCLAVIICCILYIWGVVKNHIYYNIIQEEIYSLDVKEYAQLGNGELFSQTISLDKTEAVLLEKISTIVINVTNVNEGGIGVRLKKNGEIISESQKYFKDIVLGDWFDIEISAKLYPQQEYEFEWYAFGTEEAPYLLILEENQGAASSEKLYKNGVLVEGSLALNYEYKDIISFTTKIIMLAILVVVFVSIAIVVFDIKYKNRLWQICALLLILTIAILPLLVLGKYNRPSADDYSYSANTYATLSNGGTIIDILKTALDEDINAYKTWQGLYVSAFVLALQPGIFGEQYYALTTPILMIIMGLSLYIALRIIGKRFAGDSKLSLFYAIVLVGIIVAGMPSALEGLYWYNGAMNYLPFVFLAILNLALIVEYYFSGRVRWAVISIVISFIISGGNHVSAFFNILMLTIAIIICTCKKKYAAYATWISAIIGFIIMYKAPGTKIRADLFEKRTVIETLIEAVVHSIKEMGGWFNIQLVCIILFFLPCMLKIVRNNKNIKLVINPICIYITCYIVLIGLYCVPYYAMGYFGAGRLKNVIWVAFLTLLLISISYTLCWLNNKHFGFIENVQLLDWGKAVYRKCVLLIILGCCLFGNYGDNSTSNSMEALDELATTGVAKQYAVEMDARYYELKHSTSDTLYFKELTCEPKLLVFSKIGDDFWEWPNPNVTSYYGKKVATYHSE